MEATTMISEWLFALAFALLLYAYFLYPAAALFIGSRRAEPSSADLVPVSFVVPAHNEAAVILAKIENFKAIDYPPELIELLIADDGSTDGTADIVRPYLCERVRLLEFTERSGKAAIMNRLVEAAKHPYILFSDANVMLASKALRRLVTPLRDRRVGAVTGEVHLVGSDEQFSAGESLYYWLERRLQRAESRIGSVMGVDGGMYLLSRRLFQPLPEDTILDDFLVSINVLRSRHRIVFESSAQAIESGTPSTRQEFSRRVRIAAGAVQLLKRWEVPLWTQPVYGVQFFSHKILRWLSPLLLATLLVSNVLLLQHDLWYQIAFALQVLAYLLFLATCLSQRLRRTRMGAVLFYFGFSQIAMTIGLFKGLANRQVPQWEKAPRSVCGLRSLGA